MADRYTIIRTENDERYHLCEIFMEPEQGCMRVETDRGVTVYLKSKGSFEDEEQAREALAALGGPNGHLH